MASATPPIGRQATASADNGFNLPTDVFVEILLRLPPTKRWRLRLVCRHWRDVIRDRTPAPAPAPPTALAFVVSSDEGTAMSASAFTIDNPANGRCREVWRSSNPRPARIYDDFWKREKYERTFDTEMVGTRNGVLCLCDNKTPGGAVSLANPATGETLALPPLPCSGHWKTWGTTILSWHEAYAFAYDPYTERYWVVHVPSFFDRNGVFAALHVFTLGGDGSSSPPASWREVPVAGAAASCRLDAGFVTIDGTMHWVTEGTERVVSFDLAAEQVTSTMALPAPDPGRGPRWCLTEVHGRLGAVDYSANRCWERPEMTHVWVLEGGGGRDGRRQEWSRRYSVQVYGVGEWLAAPVFAFGEHVLTTKARGGKGTSDSVFVHRMPPGRLRISWKTPEVRVSGISSGDRRDDSVRIHGVFAYVKNKEPLRAYYNPQAS
ncbi:unnamed protein product [Urochloa humidicola]